MKFIKPSRTDIKILLALQQDVFKCAGNFISDVRLQVNVEDRLAKLFSKKLKKMSFISEGLYSREVGLNFNYFIASRKLNYGDIFSFLNKLTFDDSNICTKVLNTKQKIINFYVSYHKPDRHLTL